MLDLMLALILLVPLYFDIKEGIIPNYFIIMLLVVGLIINIYLTGFSGLLTSISGFLLALFLFLIPFIVRGLGAGDVKLIAAIGAVKGPGFIFINSLVVAIVGGLISVLILLKENKLEQITSLFNKLVYRIPLENLEQQKNVNSFPYGVAIVIGTWCSLLLSELNMWPI
ncbi:A24 family peptidase [Halanaerobacter jeridensis]|uniref:Prepilin peptidase CpaA n=1 Tax=Halanaerobacter jeridensis TaxID=706427 RepID=A0A939BPK9_9FIRM|nr:prepilin peptidase [Halanaerobacter jeridensis]MBM7557197.1 prepilin peptidase CpaA [Halanaerobacter jeridensis]